MSDTLKIQRAQLPLAKLAIPLFLENILRTALSSVDVIMISNYNDYAVAAVGLVTTLTFFLIIVYSMVSSGTTVLIAQYLGAGKEREAADTSVASFVLGIIFSIVLSLGMCFGAHSILDMYTLEPAVRNYAWQYLVIYSAGSIFVAFNIIQSNILRAYGHAKDSMVSNMVANVLNIGGNALFLFGPEGMPFRGVVGVTLSTVLSQAVSCAILAVRIKQRKDVFIPWQDLKKIPARIYKKLLAIGIPTAGENLAYTIMTIIIGIPISQYGTSALNTHTFLNTVMRFVFMPAFSIGVAGQIKTGYLIGAKMFDKAKKQIFQYFGIGMAISVIIMLIVFMAQEPIFRIFTKDPKVFHLLTPILLICLLREVGRVSNIVVIPGLKGSGDVNFPVIVGIISMWGIAAGIGTLLGTFFGLGLVGIWIGIAADELIRGVIMLFRWQSGAWVSKRMVDDNLPPDALLEEQTAVI